MNWKALGKTIAVLGAALLIVGIAIIAILIDPLIFFGLIVLAFFGIMAILLYQDFDND